MDQTGCSRTKDACSSKGASSKNREVAQADTRRNAKKGIRAWRITGFARVGLFITTARQPRSDAALLGRCIDPKKALNPCRNADSIEKNLGRAKAILGKRRDFIHGRWGLSDLSEQAGVSWHSVPFKPEKPARPVPLSELTGLVDSIRSTAQDITAIAENLYDEWPPYSSRPKRRKRQASSTRAQPVLDQVTLQSLDARCDHLARDLNIDLS
jgi:hypothetical protein